ncbi:MAG TPA: thioesterase [Candidatus Limiplasma sp.]|nr:thioesterase [Candidatus Limiplasma sp.]HPS81906.1 thioesterase [Candidatus Limiplasma sp.]
MNGFFEQSYFLRAADTDLNGEWRASGIFLAMQEAGGAHCEGYNLGMAALREQNIAWVVSRAHVRMERLPRIGETVTVRTWPKPPQHFFFPRYYQFWVDGQTVGSAATLYAQLDLTTRRMVKPWLGGNDQLDCELTPPLPVPGGIPTLETPAETYPREARYSDLDVNGHVNNTRYLDWFCDSFDVDYHRAWALKDVLIHYNREIRPGERALLSLQTDGARTVMKGECDGAACFAISGSWEKR